MFTGQQYVGSWKGKKYLGNDVKDIDKRRRIWKGFKSVILHDITTCVPIWVKYTSNVNYNTLRPVGASYII